MRFNLKEEIGAQHVTDRKIAQKKEILHVRSKKFQKFWKSRDMQMHVFLNRLENQTLPHFPLNIVFFFCVYVLDEQRRNIATGWKFLFNSIPRANGRQRALFAWNFHIRCTFITDEKWKIWSPTLSIITSTSQRYPKTTFFYVLRSKSMDVEKPNGGAPFVMELGLKRARKRDENGVDRRDAGRFIRVKEHKGIATRRASFRLIY